MFKKLFGKKTEESVPVNKEIVLFAPMNGSVVALEDVPDPVFAEKMMGDGLAIEPGEDTVYSPVDGEIVQVFPTKHAVGIKALNGAEILIHIGLETVGLNGEGFEAFVSAGDKVKMGDKLISFNQTIIKEKAKSTIIPIIITNSDDVESIVKTTETSLTRGETQFFKVTIK
ncbi:MULTISPECIES: PTS sugar transporter subunit IIA [Bacillaceae]|uniref:PTS system glucose-specific IIA component n=1 Tax=Peribacillus huizhouensis TaxID=1501239 RepID=A0ABR6CTQ0_9BACI|nr:MULTISPECIES: PTS glucose transporter subunit IIA [Bacillaceae]MBA9027702.1 PTS system glucose-specific IIA component [Peribacillus huizhouensis]